MGDPPAVLGLRGGISLVLQLLQGPHAPLCLLRPAQGAPSHPGLSQHCSGHGTQPARLCLMWLARLCARCHALSAPQILYCVSTPRLHPDEAIHPCSATLEAEPRTAWPAACRAPQSAHRWQAAACWLTRRCTVDSCMALQAAQASRSSAPCAWHPMSTCSAPHHAQHFQWLHDRVRRRARGCLPAGRARNRTLSSSMSWQQAQEAHASVLEAAPSMPEPRLCEPS